MDPPTPSSPGALTRALGLLTSFDAEDSELSAAELARRAGLPRSTTHRLATELVQKGFLERMSDGHFRLGLALFELGQLSLLQRGLREAANSYLADLSSATHQRVHLAVLEGAEVVYLDVISPSPNAHARPRIGGRLPATDTAVGKAILAFSTPGQVDRVIGAGLRRLTPNSITDESQLRAELTEIRRTGVAYDNQEQALGTSCCGAPILGRGGEVVGAISVCGPTGVLHFNLVIAAVRFAAAGISRMQGAGSGGVIGPGAVRQTVR